jgi:hypothetical protein
MFDCPISMNTDSSSLDAAPPSLTPPPALPELMMWVVRVVRRAAM